MGAIDMAQLKQRGPQDKIEELRIEIFDKVNALGIGAQGLGGLATILDVKIMDWPTHAASKPIAMIPNCAATRHAHFTLDGSGPVYLEAPKLDEWPDVNWTPSKEAKRSEEHTSELQSLMRISYAVFCLKKKKKTQNSKEHINTSKTISTKYTIKY